MRRKIRTIHRPTEFVYPDSQICCKCGNLHKLREFSTTLEVKCALVKNHPNKYGYDILPKCPHFKKKNESDKQS